MPRIDLAFRLTSTQPLSADHGYTLYGAISRLLPDAHRENGIAIHPIRGRIVGHRQMIHQRADELGPGRPLANARGKVCIHRLGALRAPRLSDQSARRHQQPQRHQSAPPCDLDIARTGTCRAAAGAVRTDAAPFGRLRANGVVGYSDGLLVSTREEDAS